MGQAVQFTTTLIGTPGLVGGDLSIAYALDAAVADGTGLLAPWLIQFEMIFWMVCKIYMFIFFAMWLRGTLPRLKPDQLMGFSWKFLIPLSLINVFMVAFWRMFIPPAHRLESNTVEALLAAASNNLPFGIIWLGVLMFGVGGFCWFMSQLMTNKLRARFSQS